MERWPVTVAFVRDPDGYLVELVERHPWPDDAPAGAPWLGQYCLNVTDIERDDRLLRAARADVHQPHRDPARASRRSSSSPARAASSSSPSRRTRPSRSAWARCGSSTSTPTTRQGLHDAAVDAGHPSLVAADAARPLAGDHRVRRRPRRLPGRAGPAPRGLTRLRACGAFRTVAGTAHRTSPSAPLNSPHSPTSQENPMIRLSVLYPEDRGRHLRPRLLPRQARARWPRRPGALDGVEIDKGINGPYVAAVHFVFESMEAMAAAMGARGNRRHHRRRRQLHDDHPGPADQRDRGLTGPGRGRGGAYGVAPTGPG